MEVKNTDPEKSVMTKKSKSEKLSDNPQVQHVVIRVKSDNGNTISGHKKVIEINGRVLFGKIGKDLGTAFIDQLNSQINREVTTYLFVATYEGWNVPFGIYQCKLLRVHVGLRDLDKELIPKYLHPVINGINTWFEIQTIHRVSAEEVKRIYILSSGREINGAMRGTTAVFRVGIKGDIAMKLVPDPILKTKNQSDSISTEFDDDFGDDDYDLKDFEHYPR